MKIVDTSAEQSRIDISREDLLILNAALNEVCNGIDIIEFETRMGADRGIVAALLKDIGILLDKMDGSD